MMWILFLPICASSSIYLPDISDIIRPVVQIPITVVFLGTHGILNEEIAQEIKTQWFRGLSHEITQGTLNSSDFHISSEIIKVPALNYRFDFTLQTLPNDTNDAFEDVLYSISRVSGNGRGTRTVHPYPLEAILNSIVDSYAIKGNVFFVFTSGNHTFTYCEGVFSNEFVSNPKHTACPNFNLDLGKSGKWSDEIKSAVSNLGNWSTGESVMSILSSCKGLERESRIPSGARQCGLNWAMQNSRIFFMDASNYANKSVSEKMAVYGDKTTLNEKLADSVSTFDQMCSKEKLADEKFCRNLKNYIEELRKREKNPNNDDRTYYYRFLTNISAIIMDGLRSYSVPDVPSFATELPDKFVFYVSQILQNQSSIVNTSELEEALAGYVIGGAKYEIRKEKMGLWMWPYLALPLADLKPIGSHLQVKWDAMREGLQDSPISHKIYGIGNETLRDIVANLVVVNERKPILFNTATSSFAFDSVSVAISNSNAFDPGPLLRSCLLHMYGLQPSKRWRSLSVLSLYSRHTELSLLSKDAAYRNAIRVDLSKSKAKITKRVQKMQEIVDFAKDGHALAVREDDLDAKITEFNNQIMNVVTMASDTAFENIRGSIKQLRAARKSFSKQLKQILQDTEDQMCQNAPVNLVVKPPSILDKLDYYASMTSIAWLGTLVATFMAMLYTCARNLKRD